ncbi:hypothetical protein RZU89_08395 [Campylobacter coli]
MVGFNINDLWYEIGNGDFLHAFLAMWLIILKKETGGADSLS